jgi:hypothetical protein
MTGLLQDVLYSVRQIRRAPGFAVAAIITIALGISANSTIFSWIQSTLLTPIPAVTHTNNFFSVERGVPNDNPTPPYSYPDLKDVQRENRTLVGMLGYHYFESMEWIDSFANASMILSGMGPLEPMKTNGGKIFAGIYALYSGLALIGIAAIVLAPVFRRFLHRFHLDEKPDVQKSSRDRPSF